MTERVNKSGICCGYSGASQLFRTRQEMEGEGKRRILTNVIASGDRVLLSVVDPENPFTGNSSNL